MLIRKKRLNNMDEEKKIIPIFFATDDNYIPFLAVSMKSLLDNASKEYFYNIHILTDGLSDENINLLKYNMSDNSTLIVDNMNTFVKGIEEDLNESLRDYYTISIFYRLFIAKKYPEYHKAIYLDCDITVVGDISELYNTELDGNIFGVVVDDVIGSVEEFKVYATEGVGVRYDRYFNSGMLVMDLDKYRSEDILNRFIKLLTTYNFETAAPDQDYLNVLCKDKVKYLDKGWNRMSVDEDFDGKLNLIHYNNFRKPWYYDNVPYGKYFWEYAKKTNFYDKILGIKNAFGEEQAEKHIKGAQGLVAQTIRVVNSDKNFKKVLFDK
ncbi:MAG: glycosyltransferase family 8 protein [Clostridiales bacterium]|nr:glycosyltransferase family 8 protein [Clostridiales bacterium]